MITLNKLKATDAVSNLPSFINAELSTLATAINAQSTILNDSSKTLNLTGENSPAPASVYAANTHIDTANVNTQNVNTQLNVDGGKFSVGLGGKLTKINDVTLPVPTGITSTDTDADKLTKLINALKSIGLISVS